MGFLSNVLDFEGFNAKKIGGALLKDPSRLVTGVDPASTWAWNGVLGTHNHPLVDQMGGATGETYKQASDAGIDTHDGRMMQNAAHAVAAAFALSALSGAAGGAGAGAGGVGAGDGGGIAAGGVGGTGGADVAGLEGLDSAAVSSEGAEPGLFGSYGPASSTGGLSSINYQKLLGNALQQQGKSQQQQAQQGGRMYPVNTQPGNVPWNFVGGA